MKTEVLFLYAAALLSTGCVFATPTVCYVDAKASGSSDGTEWSDAYTDLQSALTNAACAEIWVSSGVYKPAANSTPVDRNASFVINPGVAVYGGFAGSELLRDARDPKTNTTVLSGDIRNDDAHSSDSQIDATWNDIHGDNSYHVVRMDGTTGVRILADTVLDGFTITGGHADGASDDYNGGGLFCEGAGSEDSCSPTLSNITFSGNAARYGGALFNNGFFRGNSSPTLTHVVFSGNFADENGGAIYDYASQAGISSPNLTDVVFDGNVGRVGGGAMYNVGRFGGESSPTLSDVVFDSNYSWCCGGAIYNDGSQAGDSSPSQVRVIFTHNGRDPAAPSTEHVDGGAVFNNGTYGGNSNPTFSDAIFINNGDVGGWGGAIASAGTNSGRSNPRFTNTTFRDNTANRGGVIFTYVSGTGESNPALINTTFIGNTAEFGAAIYLEAKDASQSNLSLTSATFKDNRTTWFDCHCTGVIVPASGSVAVLNNVIMWDDEEKGSEVLTDAMTPITVNYSIIDGGCPTAATCTAVLSVDPLLGTLAENGGFTPTIMLDPSSRAIDNGSDDPAACPATDQRGVARPQGRHCDIGAVEFFYDIIFKDDFENSGSTAAER